MKLDIPSLAYSDALIYLEDFLSDNPVFGITEDEYFAISTSYNIDTKIPVKA